jgi:hypothetical protein
MDCRAFFKLETAMPITLHDAFVRNCQQMLSSLSGLIDKGEAFAKENGISEEEMIGSKLAEDMWSLPWHVRSCWVHSAFVLEQLPSGEFSPDFTEQPHTWDAMRAEVKKAQDALANVDEAELEALANKTIGFVLGGKRIFEMPAKDFLLSMSQPNVYFHATTFYDILRHKGVPIGKRDFLGAMRFGG